MQHERLVYADGVVFFVVDKVGSYSSDEADLLDSRFVDSSEKANTVRAWMETAAAYRGTPCPETEHTVAGVALGKILGEEIRFHGPKLNTCHENSCLTN